MLCILLHCNMWYLLFNAPTVEKHRVEEFDLLAQGREMYQFRNLEGRDRERERIGDFSFSLSLLLRSLYHTHPFLTPIFPFPPPTIVVITASSICVRRFVLNMYLATICCCLFPYLFPAIIPKTRTIQSNSFMPTYYDSMKV